MIDKDIKRTFRANAKKLSRVSGVYVNEAAEYKIGSARMTRGKFGTRQVCGDAEAVSYEVHWFLKRLALPARVAILFKGWGARNIATIVADVSGVYWDNCDYPRVDFVNNPPAIVEEYLGGGGFWGGFILAIAKVPSTMGVMGQTDPTLQIFTELVEKYAVGEPRT